MHLERFDLSRHLIDLDLNVSRLVYVYAGMKDNVEELFVGADDEVNNSGLKEPQRDGRLMWSSFPTKEDIHLPSE